MDKNEWVRAGEHIRDQVQRAIDTGNYANLGKDIGDTVNETLGGTLREVGSAMDAMERSVNRTVGAVEEGIGRAFGQSVPSRNGSYVNQTPPPAAPYGKRVRADSFRGQFAAPSGRSGQPPLPLPPQQLANRKLDARLFQRTPKGSIAGVLYAGMGYGLSAIAGLCTIASVGELLAGISGALTVAAWGGCTLAGLFLGAHGSALLGRAKRYRRYVDMVKDKLYCSFQEMAARTGKTERFVARDVKKMIHLGMFRQGRLDQKETCLIASDEMYGQYMLAQQNYEEEQRKAEEERLAGEKKAQDGIGSSEAATVIEEGNTYIRLIRQCNDDIPGEEMSEKLDRLEALVTRIFAQVEAEPALAPELRKMLHFYLPTTKKLLEAYRDLDGQGLELSNVTQTKREIEAAVDNINEAFGKFLDELFREKAWDIQSDISALHTILKQDGYL